VSAESGRSSHFGPEMPENARDITTANTIPEVIAAIRVKIGDYAAPDLPELVERLGVKTTTAMLGPIFRNGHKAEKIVNILRGAACFENVLPHIPGEG
jgi:predicted flavoprotein YhiN